MPVEPSPACPTCVELVQEVQHVVSNALLVVHPVAGVLAWHKEEGGKQGVEVVAAVWELLFGIISSLCGP